MCYYWPALWASIVLLAGVCRLSSSSSSSVTLPAGGRAGHRACERTNGWYCTAGQYGYVPLRRHLVVFCFIIVLRVLLILHSMLYCNCVHADVMVCVCQTKIKKLLTYWRWRGGATRRELDLRSTGRGFKSYSGQNLRNNLGQVVHTYVPLSPSSTTWYRPRSGDALQLGR